MSSSSDNELSTLIGLSCGAGVIMGGAGGCSDTLGFKLNAMVGILGGTRLVLITVGGGMLVLGKATPATVGRIAGGRSTGRENAGGGIVKLGSAIGCSVAGRRGGICESLGVLATGSCNEIVVLVASLGSSGGERGILGGARVFEACKDRALSLGKSNGIVNSSVLVLYPGALGQYSSVDDSYSKIVHILSGIKY